MPSQPLSLLSVFLFLFLSASDTADFHLSDNYLVACAASSIISLDDGRQFFPDSSPSAPFSFSSPCHSSTISFPSHHPGQPPPLYRSSRVFHCPSFYSFPLSSSSPLLLRLHFLPLSNHSFSFSISASGLPLLTHFTPPSSSPHLLEFLIPLSPPSAFLLSFTPSSPSSLALINAIELFSSPSSILPSPSPAPLIPILQLLHRINVGGPSVTPVNDTLWRSWTPDSFLISPSLSRPVFFSGRINYPNGGATPLDAPDLVYSSAQVLNWFHYNASNSSPPFSLPRNRNLTWGLPVPRSSHGYFVRMHFCDIVSAALNQLYFDVFINGYPVYRNLDLSSRGGFTLASPYYVDFFVGSDSGYIQVTVGPSERSLPEKVNAILNGLEIYRMNGAANFYQNPKKMENISAIIVSSFLGLLVLVFVIVLFIVSVWQRRMKQRLNSQLEGSAAGSSYSKLTVMATPSTAAPTPSSDINLKIPFSEILLATNYFHEKCLIGSGGFGKVYKGTLRNGMLIAVKRGARDSQQGLQEFRAEVELLSRTRHHYLLSLIGYCEEQSEMILVYEFMEKGPLRSYLYGVNQNPPLSWKQRREICIDSARGLHYLHTCSSQPIIHRDVKSSNILLDKNYTAKVSDFGLSRMGPHVNQTHVSTGVKGSFGYLDPEYFKTQQLTEKSDVYSFGVVMLEVLCARPVIDQSLPWEQVCLAEWAIHWLKKGRIDKIIDPSLKGKISYKSLKKYGETAECCLAQYGVDRPAMFDVLSNIDYVLQLHESENCLEKSEDGANASS